MANNRCEIKVNIKPLLGYAEDCTGEVCSICGDIIIGNGHRLSMTVGFNDDLLFSSVHETDKIYCESCVIYYSGDD